MPWPPREGELLPRYKEPLGIEEKLRGYALVLDHKVGGPKAKGFRDMLGIDLSTVDYLAQEIRTGIAHADRESQVRRSGRGVLPGSIFDCWARALQSSHGLAADGLEDRRAIGETPDGYGLPAKRRRRMSATETIIGEHDVVALLDAVDGWPKGTEGAVVDDQPGRKWVEVTNGRGECLDILFVPTEQLRLVWKCPMASS